MTIEMRDIGELGKGKAGLGADGLARTPPPGIRYMPASTNEVSVEEALAEAGKYPPENVYCIGGESIYGQMLPYCTEALVTKIDFAYEADSYFPNLDEMPEWQLEEESEEQTYFDLEYRFLRYTRKV